MPWATFCTGSNSEQVPASARERRVFFFMGGSFSAGEQKDGRRYTGWAQAGGVNGRSMAGSGAGRLDMNQGGARWSGGCGSERGPFGVAGDGEFALAGVVDGFG
jgi:hypothetical protein